MYERIPTLGHLFEHSSLLTLDIQRLDLHQQQGCDHGKTTDAVDQETLAFAEGCNHEAGDRRR